jgi:hypothetical protein
MSMIMLLYEFRPLGYRKSAFIRNFQNFGIFKVLRNAKVEITTNTTEIQEIIRDYFENLYSNTFENLEEMDIFLNTYDHPK